MPTRAVLYFIVPIICYCVLFVWCVANWMLRAAYLCVTGYIHGYLCMVEYRITRRADLLVSLAIFGSSIGGGYLYSVCEGSDSSVVLYISDLQACLYLFAVNVFASLCIYTQCNEIDNAVGIMSRLRRLLDQHETFESMMITLRATQPRKTADTANCQDDGEAFNKNNMNDENHLVETILKQRQEQFVGVEKYWNDKTKTVVSLFHTFKNYGEKKSIKIKNILKAVASSFVFSLFIFVCFSFIVSNDSKDLFIWLVLYSLMFCAQLEDVWLSLSSIEFFMCKLLVSTSVTCLWSMNNDKKEKSLGMCFVGCEMIRSFENLIWLPYIKTDEERYAADLRWGQFTAVLGVCLVSVIKEIDDNTFIGCIMLLFIGNVLLHILELKLIGRVNLRYNVALLVICLTLFVSIYDGKQSMHSFTSKGVALITMLVIYKCFHCSLLKVLATPVKECIFTVRVLYDMIRNKNIIHVIGFVIMQLLHISCYFLFGLFIWQVIRSDTCTQMFKAELIHVNISSDIECKNLPNRQVEAFENNILRNNKTCRAILHANVILHCEANIQEANQTVGEIYWKFDYSYLSNGNKYLVEKHQVNDSLLVSQLTIYDLNKFDYGTYYCFIHYLDSNVGCNIDENCHNQRHKRNVMIGAIQLLKYKTRTKLIQAPLGSRIRISLKQQDKCKEKLICRNVTNLRLITMHNSTVDTSDMGGLPLMSFYNWMYSAKQNFESSTVENSGNLNLYIHPSMIGEFKIEYLVKRRPLKYESVKAMQLTILPRSHQFYNRTYNRLLDQIAERRRKRKQITESDWEKIRISTETYYSLQYVAEGIALLLLLILSIVLLCLLLKLFSFFNYCCHFLMLYVVGRSFDRSVLHTRRYDINKRCDVFVSFSDDCDHGRTFVQTNLIHFLKNNCGFSVTSQDDVFPGALLYDKLTEKMSSSRKVVIVWSAEYGGETDAFVQLQMLLIPLIDSKLLSRHDVFIIRYGDAPIPLQVSLLGEVIEWNFTFGTEEVKLNQLREKIQQSIDGDASLAKMINRWFNELRFI